MPRRKQFSHTVDSVARGVSVHITGDYGSGRSHFLAKIATHFTQRRWSVVSLKGTAVQLGDPVAPFSLAGVEGTSPTDIIAGMSEVLGGNGVILVDDFDHLDAPARAIIDRVRDATDTPVVSTSATGFGGTRSPTFARVRRVEFGATPYADFVCAVQDTVNVELAPAAAAALFTYAAGNIGLGIVVAETSIIERRVRLSDGQVGFIADDLWSDSLAPLAESVFAAESAAEREMVSTIAVAGSVDFDDLMDEDYDTASRLIQRNMLQVHSLGERKIATVRYPVVADLLRAQRPAPKEPGYSPGADWVGPFLSLTYERSRAALADAQEAWSRSPTLGTAANLMAVMRSGYFCAVDVESVIAASRDGPGSDDEARRWAFEVVVYLVALRRTPDAVEAELERLRKARPSIGVDLKAWAAFSAGTAGQMGLVPAFTEEERRETEPRRFELYAAVIDGRLADAQDIDVYPDIETPSSTLIRLIDSIGQAAMGTHSLSAAAADIAEARDRHDIDGMISASYVGAVAALVAGSWSTIASLATAVEPLVRYGDVPPPLMSGLRAISGAVTPPARRPKLVPDRGPLPGLHPGYADVAALVGDGDFALAANALKTIGDEHWHDGANLAAAFAYFIGIIMDPADARSDRLERIAAIQGPAMATVHRHAVALLSHEVPPLVDSVREIMHEYGLPAASESLDRAARSLRRFGMNADADALVREFDDFEDTSGWSRGVLTDREREIASMAVGGMTNAAIAAALFISIRTVESHLARAMRKLGVRRRAELIVG